MTIIKVLAIFGGSFVAAHLYGSRGLIIGLISESLIFLMILLISAQSYLSLLIKGLYCLFSGMAGGFLGMK